MTGAASVSSQAPDVFGTNDLRTAVLRAWAESSTRLREDTNAEEDYAQRYYRDRVVLELAQNASDAALRTGVPGRLKLHLKQRDNSTWVLSAANTGTPMNRGAIAALSSLRASAKTGNDSVQTAGRFGVGFAAVRAISQRIHVKSSTGAVLFDAEQTRKELERLAAQLGPDWGGHDIVTSRRPLPILRLPFPDVGLPDDGFETEIVLDLTDETSAAAVAGQLNEIDDLLLLSLPGLTSLEIEFPEDVKVPGSVTCRQLRDVHERWDTVRVQGTFTSEELRGLAYEDQQRITWDILWARPRSTARPHGINDVEPQREWPIHAPTPTDDTTTVGAVLIGSFPLDPTRRTITAGPASERLLAEAAQAYGNLVEKLAATQTETWWTLVPSGSASGLMDAQLRKAILADLHTRQFLPTTTPYGEESIADLEQFDFIDESLDHPTFSGMLRPRMAVAASEEIMASSSLTALAERHILGLVTVPVAARLAANSLHLPCAGLTELVESVAARAHQTPSVLTELYEALAEIQAQPGGLDRLPDLPVRLADGRLIRGARGVFVPTWSPAEISVTVLERIVAWGVRLADAQYSHPVLEAAGAQFVDPLGFLVSTVFRDVALGKIDAILDAEDDDTMRLPSLDGKEIPLDSFAAAFTQWPQSQPLFDVSGTVLSFLLSITGSSQTDSQPEDDPVVATQLAWIGELPLPDADGYPTPANQLVLPNSIAAQLFSLDDVSLVDPLVVEQFGAPALALMGVRSSLPVTSISQTVLGEDDLDTAGPAGWDDYIDFLVACEGSGALLGEQDIIVDLDLIHPDAWSIFLDELGQTRRGYQAVTVPATVENAHGQHAVPSYSAWILSQEIPWAAGGLSFFLAPEATWLLRRLVPSAPQWVTELAQRDERLARAVGAVARCSELSAQGWADLMQLASDVPEDSVGLVIELWRELCDAAQGDTFENGLIPTAGPVIGPDGKVVFAELGPQTVICGEPQWIPRTHGRAFIPTCGGAHAELLADLLGATVVTTAPEGHPWPQRIDSLSSADPLAVPAVVRDLLGECPATWHNYDDLVIDDLEVPWWVFGAGETAEIYAATLDGAARGLAWASGKWQLRSQVLELLEDPEAMSPVVDSAFTSG